MFEGRQGRVRQKGIARARTRRDVLHDVEPNRSWAMVTGIGIPTLMFSLR